MGVWRPLDTFTHILVPYAFFTLLRRPMRQRVAAALGGLAPDSDTLWAWFSHTYEGAYPFVHRGFSHTLWGAPILATILLFIASRPFWAKRWPRMGAFQWTPDVITPLWLGAWSHLLLDGMTITGVPLLWPFSEARFSTNWFFFAVPYLLPISLIVLFKAVWRPPSDRFVLVGTAVLLVVLGIGGAIRFSSYPVDVGEGADIAPGPVDWHWYVSVPSIVGGNESQEGVTVFLSTWGGVRGANEFFPHHNLTAAALQIKACQARPGYTAWKWNLWGFPVINATQASDGGWHIVFQDSDQLYMGRHPDLGLFRPSRNDADMGRDATCTVTADGQASIERGRGWLGS